MRKARESENAEGAEMRKTRESGKAECDRIVGRWMDGRGVTERRMDGKKDGWTEGRNVLRRCERLGLSLCAVPSLNGTVCVFLFWKGYGGRGWKECGRTE